MKLELRTIVASISLWLTTTGEWKCPPEVEVKADGSLINELGLFHHSPCKCIILGQCHGEVVDSDNRSRIKIIPDNRLVSSIPGDYSRKPPIGGLLKEYSSGHGPTRCLELFAREMVSGSVSWGNEPLDFQDSRYLYECRDGQYIYTKALFFGRHF
ncbi:hypothetical protein TIFTF001_005304 [Ficus carica]|uniref:Uncharacterized protein n=1 Tax=Ficus carica TaxID=3494 RepID=A0AA88CYG6_FICCA|nr:hypothetical protein TIFTF001_005304 [Ficus carica]